ncbi:MAG TPA: L,D-transpeptidase family protein [Rhizomicrobium sp.]|nr:L,D-transpeptidase family protein [Rhizomicrobium sp.]
MIGPSRHLAIFVAIAVSFFIPEEGISQPQSAAARIRYTAGRYPELILPDGRHEVVTSVLDIAEPMRFGDYVWNETGVPKGPVWIRIDLSHQLLSVFRDGQEIGSAVILFGGDKHDTPTGSFTVLSKDEHYFSHAYHAPMPYALRLTKDGVAIHGSNVREGWATHGCIGVPMDFARLLFTVASKGDVVAIVPAKTPEKQG